MLSTKKITQKISKAKCIIDIKSHKFAHIIGPIRERNWLLGRNFPNSSFEKTSEQQEILQVEYFDPPHVWRIFAIC